MNIYAASLALECNYDRFPAISMKVASASLSLMPIVPAGVIASLALECNYDRFPAISMKVASASLSLIAQPVLATMLSISLVCSNAGFTEVIDLKKGTSMLMIKADR